MKNKKNRWTNNLYKEIEKAQKQIEQNFYFSLRESYMARRLTEILEESGYVVTIRLRTAKEVAEYYEKKTGDRLRK